MRANPITQLQSASGRYVRVTGGYRAAGLPMIKLETARRLIREGKALDIKGKLYYASRKP